MSGKNRRAQNNQGERQQPTRARPCFVATALLRQERAESLVVGRRPPNRPPRPAKSHVCSLARVLGGLSAQGTERQIGVARGAPTTSFFCARFARPQVPAADTGAEERELQNRLLDVRCESHQQLPHQSLRDVRGYERALIPLPEAPLTPPPRSQIQAALGWPQEAGFLFVRDLEARGRHDSNLLRGRTFNP